MDHKANNNRGQNGGNRGELRHSIPMPERVVPRAGRGGHYSNNEKAVTQPTPSSDQAKE